MLESIITLAILSSAIVKMNIQSIFYLVIVILQLYLGKNRSMRVLMFTISVLLIMRLMLTLSNMNQFISPMPFPEHFTSPTNQTLSTNNYGIPWINELSVYKTSNDTDKDNLMNWAYFMTLIMVERKFMSLIMDFIIIFFIFVFYVNCSFWLLYENFDFYYSDSTKKMISDYINFVKEQNNST